jgi:predicted RNase H-related nuclease YkuK (DUF458 family)
MAWRRFDGTVIKVPIKEKVIETLKSEIKAGHKLKVCIGSDSEVRSNNIDFATVIVFLREHRGGFMFIENDRMKAPLSLKERLLAEVSRSISIAYELCDILDEFNVDLEVHADINTNPQFKSNPALSEAMGYILSMGFAFKAKPDAFASSSCADKMI